MNEKIKKYYENQKAIDLIDDSVKKLRESFEESIKDYLDKIKLFKEENDKIKPLITDNFLNKFKETGSKQLDFGFGIRVSNSLQYNEDLAVSWAEKNMPVAIKQSIDKKQFEQYAKNNDLDFVKKEEKVTVTFPKELKNE